MLLEQPQNDRISVGTNYKEPGTLINSSEERFTTKLSEFNDSYQGNPIPTSFRNLVGPLPADELTHSVYPYPARLIRHIPRLLLQCRQIVKDIDHVVDPFCGAGTVLLEAQQLGFQTSGIDQNPMAALISRVKTTPIEVNSLFTECESILQKAKRTRRYKEPKKYVRKWYSPSAYSALCRLAEVISTHEGPTADAISLLLALTAKKIANTDTRINVPVKPKQELDRNATDVWKTWSHETLRLGNRLKRLDSRLVSPHVELGDTRSSDSWANLPDHGRILVFTSPPYGAAQKYIRSTSLELGWLGFSENNGTVNLEHQSIGREHLSDVDRSTSPWTTTPSIGAILESARVKSPSRASIYETYFKDMQLAIEQIGSRAARVVLISGTNTVVGNQIETYAILAEMLQSHGFRRTLSFEDEIRGRTLLTKRNSEATPSNSEYVEIFEKE